jgi:hypothetical protein
MKDSENPDEIYSDCTGVLYFKMYYIVRGDRQNVLLFTI